MFAKLKWEWYYSRFMKRWHHATPETFYTDIEYYRAIVKLFDIIPVSEKPYLYRRNTGIAIYHTNVEEFSIAVTECLQLLLENRLYNRRSLPLKKVSLSTFFENKQGYEVEYWSGLMLIKNHLDTLYKEVSNAEEIMHDSHYRQLKEILIDGLTLLMMPIREYSQY